MSKGRKRPPPSALTHQDLVHLAWIQRNSTDLVHSAIRCYHTRGRGAFLVKEDQAQPSGTTAHYLSAIAVQTAGHGWPDAGTDALVQRYDPTQQFVIVFLYRSGAVNTYTMRFVKLGATFTVEIV